MNWKIIPGIYWLHRQFWNAHSSTWDEATNTSEYRLGLEQMTQAVAQRSDDRAGTILDLGCGTGNYSIAMARDGWQVEALDLASKMLRLASAKAEAACAGQISFQQANFNRPLPLPDAAYRHALSIATLQCVGEGSFFAEVYRVLQPGGYFYGVFRDDAMRDKRPNKAVQVGKRSRRWQTIMVLKARAARTELVTHWTEDSMRQALVNAGFQVDEVVPFYRGTKLIIAARPASAA